MFDLPHTEQILIVVTPNWDAVDGKMWCYDVSAKKLSGPISITLGLKGIAWGIGLHAENAQVGEPLKKEGDNKAPAGIFAIGPLFGYGEQIPLKMPYMEVDEHLECVDDPNSLFYNRFVRRAHIADPDWKSSENMRHELYTLGAVIHHNTNSPVAGGGSCIFMHRWRGPGRGTAGCTAMEERDLQSILAWLDPTKHPVIVQLPRDVYVKVRSKWRLPLLPNL